MTGEPERPFAAASAVLAAFALGAAVTAAFELLGNDAVRVLLALFVAGVGLGVLAVRADHEWTRAFGRPVLRGVGVGLVVLGAYLAGGAFGLPSPYVVALVALALLATRALASFGVLAPIVVALLMVAASAGQTAVSLTMLVVAVVGVVVVLAAPAGAAWGDLAGATAGMAVTVAVGLGTSSLVVAGVSARLPRQPSGGILVAIVVVAAVLLMVAMVRRDLVSGLLAGSVLVVSPESVALAVVSATVAVVALLAVRVPAVRSALVGVPAALRPSRPSDAAATAACAVVAATALVLAALALGNVLLIVFALVVAGALAYFLPGSHGAALSVVTLVALLLALRDVSSGLVALAIAVAVALPLLRRHPRPPVFAAAAYLLLGVLGQLLDLPSAGWFVVLLLPLLLVGVPAAVLALRGPHVAVGQALGTLVLAMSAVLLAGRTGALTLAPTDSYHLRALGTPAAIVALTVMVLALVLVVSTARRPSPALAVAAVAAVFGGLRLLL